MGADAAVKPFAEVIHGLDGVVDALQGRKALQVEISQFERVTACSNCVFDGGGQLGAGVLEGDGKIVDRDCRGELRSCGGRGRAQVGNKSAMVKSVSCPTPVITGDAGIVDRIGEVLIVESPEVFNRTAAACQEDQIKIVDLVERLQSLD